jgi:hypothetical protein
MTPSGWRVTHHCGLAARGTVLSGVLFLVPVALVITIVPVGLIASEPHEVARAGESLQGMVGLGGPRALWTTLTWALVGLLAIPWAWLVRGAWRAVAEQVRDLAAAHRFVEGPIERLDTAGSGSRLRHRVHVAGEAWTVPIVVARQLRPGQMVRLKLTRFNALVLEVAVPQ